jgi:hypothetical protein
MGEWYLALEKTGRNFSKDDNSNLALNKNGGNFSPVSFESADFRATFLPVLLFFFHPVLLIYPVFRAILFLQSPPLNCHFMKQI